MEFDQVLRNAAEKAISYREGLLDGQPAQVASYEDMLETFRAPLPEAPADGGEIMFARSFHPMRLDQRCCGATLALPAEQRTATSVHTGVVEEVRCYTTRMRSNAPFSQVRAG